MSRRRRHQEKESEAGQIEWLRHRTGYPTAAEREQILQLRRQLSLEIIGLAISRAERDDPRFRELIDKYGEEEVLRAQQVFREDLDIPSLIADDAKSNRDYRLRYSRLARDFPILRPGNRMICTRNMHRNSQLKLKMKLALA